MIDDTSETDPYQAAFLRCANRDGCSQESYASLSSKQWNVFLSELVTSGLLQKVTAARFSTDYHGAFTLDAFQDKLIQWTTPDDPTNSTIDALDQHITVLERLHMASSQTNSIPAQPNVLTPLVTRQQDLCEQLDDLQTNITDQVIKHMVETQLFGASAREKRAEVRPGDCPWRFQLDSRPSLIREERRRRPLRVERLKSDCPMRIALADAFAPRLIQLRDIEISAGAATTEEGTQHTRDDVDARSQVKRELVTVLSLRRQQTAPEAVAWLDTLIGAHRELLLSPYFQQYLGEFGVPVAKDEVVESDQTEYLHCFELTPSLTLAQLIQSHGPIDQLSALLRYLSREVLLAIVDLHEQSTHELVHPITPANVLVSRSGYRVMLAKLEFGRPWDPFLLDLSLAKQRRESALLGDLAMILFAMVFGSSLPHNYHQSEFCARYLRDRDGAFVHEFLVLPETNPPILCVCRHDSFRIVIMGGDAQWIPESSSPGLALVDLDSSAFTYRATHSGDHRLVFSSTVSSPVGLTIRVHPRSYLQESSSLSTLIQACAAKTAAVSHSSPLSLRHLLDHHALFQPLDDYEQVQVDSQLHHALDAIE